MAGALSTLIGSGVSELDTKITDGEMTANALMANQIAVNHQVQNIALQDMKFQANTSKDAAGIGV